MSNSQDFKQQLREMAAASSRQADDILDEELQTLLSMTRDQLDELRPQVTDEETYNRLIEIVEEATRNNEQIAQFKARLMQGGSKLLKIGKTAALLSTGLPIG